MRALNSIRRRFSRVTLVTLSLLCMSFSVNAYTVIMRGGRHVEVPARFLVTATTLTYEVAPGVQVTLQMDAIDIPATEKVNGEAAGSLRRRALEVLAVAPDTSEPRSQKALPTRTITNRDLEASRRRRSESELAYERRRKELGLPSVEESRRRAAAESDLIAGELAKMRAAQNESESYWRARASALRTEIASVEAQLGYMRGQLEQPDLLTMNGSYGSVGVINVAPAITFGNLGGRVGFGRPVDRPNIFVAPRGGTHVVGRVGFGGGATRGQVLLNPRPFRRSFGNGSPWLALPNVTYFDPILPGYGVSYERNQLITQFNELAAARAGLFARWRELEEEARRAGVPPGWLRQ